MLERATRGSMLSNHFCVPTRRVYTMLDHMQTCLQSPQARMKTHQAGLKGGWWMVQAFSFGSPKALLRALLPQSSPTSQPHAAHDERVAAFKRYLVDVESRGGGDAIPAFPAGATWLNAPPLRLNRCVGAVEMAMRCVCAHGCVLACVSACHACVRVRVRGCAHVCLYGCFISSTPLGAGHCSGHVLWGVAGSCGARLCCWTSGPTAASTACTYSPTWQPWRPSTPASLSWLWGCTPPSSTTRRRAPPSLACCGVQPHSSTQAASKM